MQLFHKNIDAYLAAEGVWSDAEPTNSAHLRVREPDPRRPRRLLPPTSAVSFWALELASSPVHGRPITWRDVVRLKHLTTQRYLTVVRTAQGTMTAKLVESPADDSADFCLHAVVAEGDQVERDTLVRMQHISTGLWVAAGQKNRCDGRHESPGRSQTRLISAQSVSRPSLLTLSSSGPPITALCAPQLPEGETEAAA